MKNLAIILASCAIAGSLPYVTEAQSPVMCTMQYAPVCGTTAKGEFKTFGNGCTLSAEGGIYQHEGECTEAELAGRGTAETYVPPAHCIAWYDGCNSCSRAGNGDAACTLRACFAQGAGYCTAYGDTEMDKPHVEQTRPASGGSVSGPTNNPMPAAELETTTTVSVKENIFSRIWANIALWFSGWF